MPCGIKEIDICADMGAEVSPVLHVCEIAAALAGNHYLTACLGHLFQNSNGAWFFTPGHFLGGSYRGH